MSSENTVNVLQELPKIRRTKSGNLTYDLNALALSYLRNKVTEQDKRLQAIEEMLAAIYLAVDEVRGRFAKEESPERPPPEPPARLRPLLRTRDDAKEPSVVSALPPTGLRRLWAEFFKPHTLRRRPPY